MTIDLNDEEAEYINLHLNPFKEKVEFYCHDTGPNQDNFLRVKRHW